MPDTSDNQLPKRRIAVYYPNFMGGGAEAVCLWMLEALKSKYDLTLFTTSEVNLDRLNSMYGTALSETEVAIKALVPKFWQSLSYSLIANNATIRALSFQLTLKLAKANYDHFDLVISAFNAADLGGPGVQYVHWSKVIEGSPLFEKIFDFSLERLQKNVSVTNSQATAERIKKVYGIDADRVVYPPVVMNVSEIPWEQRENAFLCSGRVVKAKEPHKVIQILKAVREQGFDIKLYLTGGGGGAADWRYHRYVKRLIAENSDWITLYENLKYKDYTDLLVRCRYGIHVKQEPFGISIAEMVKGGLLPFVKRKGGQVEIVGTEQEALMFKDAPEAIEKIVQVLQDEPLQQQLAGALQERRSLFSTDRFMAEIRQVVDDYFAKPKPL